MSDTNVVVEISGTPSVEASAPAVWDSAAICAAYPWYAELPQEVQVSAKLRWEEASKVDAAILPTDGMDDAEAWQDAMEKYMRAGIDATNEVQSEADKAQAEVDLARYDATWNACVKVMRGEVEHEGVSRMRIAVASYTAIHARLAGNAARTTKIRRAAAIKELVDKLDCDRYDKAEIAARVREGACMTLLFSATTDKPIVGVDGNVYASLGKKTPPLSVDKISRMCPLCIQGADDTVEAWTLLAHVSDEIRVMVKEVIDGKLPRTTVSEAVTKLRLTNAEREVTANPANKVAVELVKELSAKVNPPADKVDVQSPSGDAGTVEVTTETPVATPSTPASLINTGNEQGEEADEADVQSDAYDMHEILATCTNSPAVWIEFLELVKDDELTNETVRRSAITALLSMTRQADAKIEQAAA